MRPEKCSNLDHPLNQPMIGFARFAPGSRGFWRGGNLDTYIIQITNIYLRCESMVGRGHATATPVRLPRLNRAYPCGVASTPRIGIQRTCLSESFIVSAYGTQGNQDW